MNINDWMITHKYATNNFAANHIFNGLGLAKIPRFWMRVKYVILYRLHRDSGEPSKVAYTKALTGVRPLELPMDELDGFCNCPAQHAFMTYIAHDETCPERKKEQA